MARNLTGLCKKSLLPHLFLWIRYYLKNEIIRGEFNEITFSPNTI